MKKYYALLTILAVPVVLLLMSNNNGSPGGRTGSPGDNGNTCTGCHNGTATSKFGWITTNIPIEGYTPGNTYTITATGTHAGVVKFGFELTIENSEGDKVGLLQLAEPTRTKLTNNSKAVTHTAAGNVPFGNTNSWTVNWVAPANVTGNIGIYAAFNAANGNGNTSGDVIYKSNTFVSEYIPDPKIISIFPDSALQGETVSTLIIAEDSRFILIEPVIYLNNDSNPLEMINTSAITVIDDNTAEAVFDIPVSASPGLWDLHVGEMILDKAFTVLLATGIADIDLNKINIFPNPANLNFQVENASGAEISVYRSNGEQVLRANITTDRQTLDISNLPSGLYLVKLQKNERTMVEKLLVN